ncbi:hypothetical protein AMECASPLE_032499, partial [Ameca splendens]
LQRDVVSKRPMTQMKPFRVTQLSFWVMEDLQRILDKDDACYIDEIKALEILRVLPSLFLSMSAPPKRVREPSKALVHVLEVQCLLCPQLLTYNNNTSSMLRHYRAKHENTQPHATNQGSRKQELDETLVDFTVKDSQPFTEARGRRLTAFPEVNCGRTVTSNFPRSSLSPAQKEADNK